MISIGIYNDSSFEYLEKCLYRGNEVRLCALVAILSLEHGVGVSLSYNLNHCAMCCFSGSLKSFYFELRDFQISYMSLLYDSVGLTYSGNYICHMKPYNIYLYYLH